MEKLTVAIVQTDLIWHNTKENKKLLSKKIDNLECPTDIIIFPEMFTTGFTLKSKEVAETMDGDTMCWLIKTARKKQCALTGSLVIKEDNFYYNRLVFVHPSGKIDYYNKRHLFSLVKEDKEYKKGKKQVTINYKGWKICPQICYDLRFPVWARNTHNYDLLLYVANWPKIRIDAWNTLLKARAIENLCYTIGVNRVGTDENNILYNGNSLVFDGVGKSILDFKDNEDAVKIVCLTKNHISKVRTKLSFLQDQDSFNITL